MNRSEIFGQRLQGRGLAGEGRVYRVEPDKTSAAPAEHPVKEGNFPVLKYPKVTLTS